MPVWCAASPTRPAGRRSATGPAAAMTRPQSLRAHSAAPPLALAHDPAAGGTRRQDGTIEARTCRHVSMSPAMASSSSSMESKRRVGRMCVDELDGDLLVVEVEVGAVEDVGLDGPQACRRRSGWCRPRWRPAGCARGRPRPWPRRVSHPAYTPSAGTRPSESGDEVGGRVAQLAPAVGAVDDGADHPVRPPEDAPTASADLAGRRGGGGPREDDHRSPFAEVVEHDDVEAVLPRRGRPASRRRRCSRGRTRGRPRRRRSPARRGSRRRCGR